jgi:hypothetical protein
MIATIASIIVVFISTFLLIKNIRVSLVDLKVIISRAEFVAYNRTSRSSSYNDTKLINDIARKRNAWVPLKCKNENKPE